MEEIRYDTIDVGLFHADKNEVHPSLSAFFGPWESIDAFNEWFSQFNLDVPNGTVIGIINEDGTVTPKHYVVPEDGNLQPYWRAERNGEGVIHIAGVEESGIRKTASTINEGNANRIYYFKNPGVLGYVEESAIQSPTKSYYPIWKNCLEYGTLDETGSIIPFEKRFYVANDGKAYLSTSDNLDEVSGGGLVDLTEQQQEALDSGIDSEMVKTLKALLDTGITAADLQELKVLRAMQIRCALDSDISNDTLSLTGKVNGTVTTRTYPLVGGGEVEPVERVYGTPSITLKYTPSGNTIGSSAGNYSPIISVSQEVYDANETLLETLTYSSLSELRAGFAEGDSIMFGYDPTTVNRFNAIDIANGDISVVKNTSGDSIAVKMKVTLVLNGVQATTTITVTQSSTESIYATSIEYVIEDDAVTEGLKNAIPYITASDNQVYDIETYSALENAEAYSFEINQSNGFTFDSASGIISFYGLSTVADALTAGDWVMNPFVTMHQNNSEHDLEPTLVPLYEFDVTDGTWSEDPMLLGIKNYQKLDLSNQTDITKHNPAIGGGRLYRNHPYNGAAGASLDVDAGDVYVFKINHNWPSCISIIESSLSLVVQNGGVASIANASSWLPTNTTTESTSDQAKANFKKLVTDKGGFEKWINLYYKHQNFVSDFFILYKVKGDVVNATSGHTKLSPIVFGRSSSGTDILYYKKLSSGSNS